MKLRGEARWIFQGDCWGPEVNKAIEGSEVKELNGQRNGTWVSETDLLMGTREKNTARAR